MIKHTLVQLVTSQMALCGWRCALFARRQGSDILPAGWVW